MGLDTTYLNSSGVIEGEVLASVVSHELRNPLNAMAGWLYLLEMEVAPRSESAQRSLAGLRQALQQQVQQVDLLHEVLQRCAPNARLAESPVCSLAGVLGLFRAELQSGVAKVTDTQGWVEVRPQLRLDVRIVGDEILLSQAIAELARYAVSASMPDAVLEWQCIAMNPPRLQFSMAAGCAAGEQSIWRALQPPSSRLSLALLHALVTLRAYGAQWLVIDDVPDRHALEILFSEAGVS